ncbi:glycosyltransferase [Sphingobium subterraneum]|uniref:Glycosyltransferase involved in cell wall biosynthesis n=1 Tax=Sphingobium subterraneum TaxID=627688 RepID=A0A841J0I7_9SPHN|nr:glycosyltransferase involved in cell wall biosynthesis [Sphingobium subterraneum]
MISTIGVDACCLTRHRTGVGNYVYDLLLPLCQQHPEVRWILYSNTDIHFPDLPNVELRPNLGGWRGVFWQNLQLPGPLRADGCDIYWGTNGFVPIGPLGAMARVVTFHDLVYRFAPETQVGMVRWSRRLFQPLSARRSDVVTSNSDATARDVERYYRVPSRYTVRPRVPPRYHLPDAQDVARVRDAYALPDDFLLVVGTLEPRKNIPLFLQAAAEVRKAGVDLPLIVHAGGTGWLSAEIEQVVAEGEASGMLRRLGYVPSEDLPPLYGACTAFCMPSIYEGFGMPILEAQMCGAPVLHGNHASMVEAGGGLGHAFEPTLDGMKAMLRALADGGCNLVSRVPSDMADEADEGLARLWQALCDAATAKGRAG